MIEKRALIAPCLGKKHAIFVYGCDSRDRGAFGRLRNCGIQHEANRKKCCAVNAHAGDSLRKP
jgi:hypothetical protein